MESKYLPTFKNLKSKVKVGLEKLRTNWNPNIYQKIKKPKIKIQSRIGNIKNQLESKYLPKLKTQRVREKNLNGQCSKERKKRNEVT